MRIKVTVAHARVIQQDIQLLLFAKELLSGTPHALQARQVQLQKNSFFASVLLELLNDRLRRCGISRRQIHFGVVIEQRTDSLLADPAISTYEKCKRS